VRWTRAKARIGLAVLAPGLAAAGWSCRPAGDAQGLVRLVEQVTPETIVESPLLALGPVGELAARPLWRGAFDAATLRQLGWLAERLPGGSLRLDDDPELGPVACLRGGRARRFPILVAARPLARYRVTRVWRSNRAILDLRVVESSVKLAVPSAVNSETDRQRILRGTFLEKGATPAVHRFTAAAAPGAWDRAAVDFTASLDTRTLVVLFERADGSAGAEACLAEVTIEELAATPEQEIALLARAWPAAAGGASPAGDLGLAKRGSLLPVRRLRNTRPPYDENYERVDALFAPAPTTLRFPVTVPAGGRLTFSYALASGSQFGDAARFEVAVRDGGGATEVFAGEAAIGEDGAGWHWRRAEVALARWSGRRVEIELRTRLAGDQAAGGRGFALWGNPIVDAPRRPGEPPNVVLIGIDTLRADRLSSYGHDRATTPNLDRLAAEGVRFDQAVSAANWTAPAFASIFTGLPASRHGVVNQELALSESASTLAERLQAGGWRTHAVVYKAFLFGLGLDQGFDRWFNLPTSRRTAQDNLDKALAWLEHNYDRRFFLFLHLDDPHQPFNQPAPFDLEFGDERAHAELGLELPVAISGRGVDGCRHCFAERRPRPEFVPVAQALYDGEVAYTDDRIGALFDWLREHGVWEDTVVAVVADHGEVIYDRQGSWGHGATLLSDELVRVPLILRPGRGRRFEEGLVVHEQVRVTDLLPTILEAAGLPAGAATAESRSLWPLIERSETADRPAFVENPERDVFGVRSREWKYVVRAPRSWTTAHQLYDLRADPGERVDVVREHPEALARMGDLLASFLLRARPGPFVLALGDGEPGAVRLVLEAGDDVRFRPFVGLTPAAAGAAGRDRPVAGGGRVLALLELELPPGHAVRATLASGERTLASRTATLETLLPWDEGLFERLAGLPAPALYFVHGAPPVGAERAAATTNLDQLEDLEALGYLE